MPAKPPPIVEGVDYYMEEGKVVFTASFHLKRGYCCNSRCRHCPYGTPPPGIETPIIVIGIPRKTKADDE
jgi:hypothetical protein